MLVLLDMFVDFDTLDNEIIVHRLTEKCVISGKTCSGSLPSNTHHYVSGCRIQSLYVKHLLNIMFTKDLFLVHYYSEFIY